MSGAQAACAEHRATHSSASGGSARTHFFALVGHCVQGGVRSPFTLGTPHAEHATRVFVLRGPCVK
eukprot:4746093-Prymnesium_polylepis.1